MFKFNNGGGNGSCSGYSTQIIQHKLATELFYILGTGNVVFKCHFVCRDGNRVCGIKATWSGKLIDSYTLAIYIYYKTGRRNCGISNQAMVQQFSRTSTGVDLTFQRPGLVVQDRTIICLLMWLLAGGW